MLAQLGTTRFEGLKTFDQFSAKVEAVFAQFNLINRKPKLQMLGLGLEQISIAIRLHVTYCNPESEIQTLRDHQANGNILKLILGNGTYVGNYVIQGLDRGYNVTDGTGNIIQADLSISLLEHADPDRLTTLQTEAELAGFANSSNNPAVKDITVGPLGAGQAVAELNSANVQGGAVNSELNEAATVPDKRENLLQKTQGRLAKMEASFESVRTTMTQGIEIYENAANIIESIDDAVTAIGTLGDTTLLGDMTTILEANQDLQDALRGVDKVSTQFISQFATRKVG